MSLSPSRKPDGSAVGSVWLSSTRMVPPSSLTGTGSSRRPCVIRSSSSIRNAARAKKPSSGMVPLALQLGDHHHREHHLVLGEPPERAGVGEQHAGVEDERPVAS